MKKLSLISIVALAIFTLPIFGQVDCKKSLGSVLDGAKFLHIQNSKFHKTLLGNKSPVQKISTFINEFEKKLNDPQNLKNELHEKFIIKKENVPESLFEFQRKLAREQGHGDITITKEMRKGLIDNAIQDQRYFLDVWIDYLTSSDATYPVWAKYWAIEGISKISNFDKQTGKFAKRTKSTVDPFPELNHEALALVIDDAKVNAKNGNFSNSNFGKAYGKKLKELAENQVQNISKIEGEWITFKRGSDHMALVNAIQGKGTGWCTVGESTAKQQLDNGDFHIFFSIDNNGKPTIPRVAIRMEDHRIGEVRGVGSNQNLDEIIAGSGVVTKKMNEFGVEGEKYLKKSKDMEMLTFIEKKVKKEKELTVKELRFLYEIDGKINGFGYARDPRIQEIINTRDKRADLSKALSCKSNQISFTKDEALNGDIIFHYGNLVLGNLKDAKELKLPRFVRGDLDLSSLKDARGLKFPRVVTGHLDLSSLKNANGLKLPDSVGLDLNLISVKSANGLQLPDFVGRDLYLSYLKNAKGVKFPNSIIGTLDLRSLKNVSDMKLPEFIGASVDLSSIKTAKGLKFPDSIGSNINLCSLVDATDIKFPNSVGGHLILSRLIKASGVELPNFLGGVLNFRSLKDASGIKFPSTLKRVVLTEKYMKDQVHLIPDGFEIRFY